MFVVVEWPTLFSFLRFLAIKIFQFLLIYLFFFFFPKIGQFILFIGFGGLALVYSILILVQERLVMHTCKVTVKFTARNRCLEMHIILKTSKIEKNNL